MHSRRNAGHLVFGLLLSACGTDLADTLDESADDVSSPPSYSAAEILNVADFVDGATVRELDRAPRISRALAERIIESRPYASDPLPLAKLDAVRGVGNLVLTALRDNVGELWCALDDGRQHCGGFAEVLINEWSAGSGGWVEIYNGGASSADLYGWTVDDGDGGSQPKTIRALPIQAGDFLVVEYGGIGSASVDRIRLFDRTRVLVDSVDNGFTGRSISGLCFGRDRDGGDVSADPLPCTAGSPNRAPDGASCGRRGGTYGGVQFTAGEECQALSYVNGARFSQLAPLSSSARTAIYERRPFASAGELAELISARQLGTVKDVAPSFYDDGLHTDTVESTFENRGALLGLEVWLDSVYVVERVRGSGDQACVELRDSPRAQNYLTGCTSSEEDAEALLGNYWQLRGTVREDRSVPGDFKIVF